MPLNYYFDKRPILMVGATGLIGSELYERYVDEGHSVKVLSTNKKFVEANDHAYYWNVEEGIVDDEAFEDIEVLVNLAGAGIAEGKWTEERKKLIYESRVNGTRLLFETCQRLEIELKFYIGTSAVGFYGPVNGLEPKVEEDEKGEGFLADVCADWEIEHKKFEPTTKHFVIARLPVVISGKGGFLTPFLLLSKYGLRVYFTKHNYSVSWMHIEDVVRFYSAVLFMDIEGTINVVTRSTSFFDMQKYVYDRYGDQLIHITLPRSLVKLMMGEMASMIVDGSHASGMKLENLGFLPEYLEFYTAVDEVGRNMTIV